jgi:hypothetical protein
MKGAVPTLASKLGGYRKKEYKKQRIWAEQVEMQIASTRPVPDWEDQPFEDARNEATHNIPDASLLESYNRLYAHPYLSGRGIRYPYPALLGLRFDAFQQRILFPCYDEEGRFRGFTGRSILPEKRLDKKNPKVRDYFGLNKRELLLGLPKHLSENRPGPKLIVEGLFDYARLVSFGYFSSKAILGTSLTDEKVDILLSSQEPVMLFMDNDLAGWQAAFGLFDEEDNHDTSNAWAYRLYKEIPVWIVPYKQRKLNGQDPGSLTREEVQESIEHAWLFTGKVPTDELGTPSFRKPS